MEHIGHAAWRVLQNARKAAIARRNDEGAERRDELFQVSNGRSAVTTRQHVAPTTAGDRAELERTRKKRPAGS